MGALGAHRGAAAPPRRQPRSACTRAGASSPLPPSIYRRAQSHRAGPSPISSRSSSSIGTGSGDWPRQGRPPRPRGCRAALPTTCCPQINQFQGFYYYFFPVSSQKEPGQEEPGQILAKKKEPWHLLGRAPITVASRHQPGHERRRRAQGSLCACSVPRAVFIFSPQMLCKAAQKCSARLPPATSAPAANGAAMHQCITTPPSPICKASGAHGELKRSRGGCTGLAPVLFLPVSPHGLVVFHHDAELGPRVQRRALQVPFEALQGRRGERASGGKLSPKAGDFHRFSPRVN